MTTPCCVAAGGRLCLLGWWIRHIPSRKVLRVPNMRAPDSCEGKLYMDVASDQAIIEILLVEDNPGDVRLTQEVFRDGRIHNRLNVVGDGVEALAYLRREGRFAESPPQDLILLDLNLPKKSGREVLAEIKADPVLRQIPVVVLTTSAAELDILEAYSLHANCYITKPVDLEQFERVIRSIEDFWLALVKLPRREV